VLAIDWGSWLFYELSLPIHAVTAAIDQLDWQASRVSVAAETLLKCFLEATKVSAALSDTKATIVVENVGISTGAVEHVFYRACVSEFYCADSLEMVAFFPKSSIFKYLENVVLRVVNYASLRPRGNLMHNCKAAVI